MDRFCGTETDELLEKAKKLAAFSNSALVAGNTITVFTMLVLQEILAQQAISPVTNFANIIALATEIAALNASLHTQA
ncbi:Hypothetical protein LUCI_5142 [Lucifera butyrica]|uniref:Uncharacterized protein n=1 Tax=Lucifera butyrica TaxID=1351585 RepID=A0A498REB8_9FIRM|nr:hypothetical protein [Lucifera butyrica]VBB09844.1 Hypothetical protein LUCI_5142 [Lucifera butyrica]